MSVVLHPAFGDLHERRPVPERQQHALVDDLHVVVAAERRAVPPLLDRQALGVRRVEVRLEGEPAPGRGEHEPLDGSGLRLQARVAVVRGEVHELHPVARRQRRAERGQRGEVAEVLCRDGAQLLGRRVVRREVTGPDRAHGAVHRGILVDRRGRGRVEVGRGVRAGTEPRVPQLDAAVVLDLAERVSERATRVRAELEPPRDLERGLGRGWLARDRRAQVEGGDDRRVDSGPQLGRYGGDGGGRAEPCLELGGRPAQTGGLGELGEVGARRRDPFERGRAPRRRQHDERRGRLLRLVRAVGPGSPGALPGSDRGARPRPEPPVRRRAQCAHPLVDAGERTELLGNLPPAEAERRAVRVRGDTERQHAHGVQQAGLGEDDPLVPDEVDDSARLRDARLDGVGRDLGAAGVLRAVGVLRLGWRCRWEGADRARRVEEGLLAQVLRTEAGDEVCRCAAVAPGQQGHVALVGADEVDEAELDAQQVARPQDRRPGQRLDPTARTDAQVEAVADLDVTGGEGDGLGGREDPAHRDAEPSIDARHVVSSRRPRPQWRRHRALRNPWPVPVVDVFDRLRVLATVERGCTHPVRLPAYRPCIGPRPDEVEQ